jgi:hypothetical protein
MVPRWFRLLVALQLAAAVALGFVAVRMVSGGVRETAAAVMHWAHSSPPPPPSWPAIPVPAHTAPVQPAGATGAVFSPDLLRRFNRDTASTATGEYALLLRLESDIADQIMQILASSSRGR